MCSAICSGLFLFIKQYAKCKQDAAAAYRYVRDIEDRYYIYVYEIDHIAVHNSIYKIAYPASEDQCKGKSLRKAETASVHNKIGEHRKHEHKTEYDKKALLSLKQAVSSAVVMNKAEAKNIVYKRFGFAELQTPADHGFAYAIKYYYNACYSYKHYYSPATSLPKAASLSSSVSKALLIFALSFTTLDLRAASSALS